MSVCVCVCGYWVPLYSSLAAVRVLLLPLVCMRNMLSTITLTWIAWGHECGVLAVQFIVGNFISYPSSFVKCHRIFFFWPGSSRWNGCWCCSFITFNVCDVQGFGVRNYSPNLHSLGLKWCSVFVGSRCGVKMLYAHVRLFSVDSGVEKSCYPDACRK